MPRGHYFKPRSYYMDKNVIVTGAAGFVGRQIVRHLTALGAKVVAIVREGNEETVKSELGICQVVSSRDLFAESPGWWEERCRGADTFLHAAWYVEPGVYLESPKSLDCLSGTLHLAKGASKAGIRRFVGLGTCFEYDVEQCLLSMDTPLKPQTLYAGTKAAAYFALSQWFRTHSVEFLWCRLFYLYGEGEDPRRLVPYLRAKLSAGESAELSSGNQIRDFLDVRDAGRLIAEAALGTRQGAMNICSGIPVTIRQFAERIADEYGSRDLLRFGAVADREHDPACIVGIV